jgi:hypothetical protein
MSSGEEIETRHTDCPPKAGFRTRNQNKQQQQQQAKGECLQI